MELQALGSDFQPDTIVEDYSSLIWTERYRPCGDFQLKTTKVDETVAQLPLGSFVGLQDSAECQIVESHVIEEDENGNDTLTITGRTFESFFENRVAHEFGVRMFTVDGDMIRSTFDSDRGAYDFSWIGPETGEAASKYILEMIKYKCMTSSDAPTYIPTLSCTVDSKATAAGGMPKRMINVKLGVMYDRILELLAMDNLGIRSILPAPGAATSNITVNIYVGVDKSATVILSTFAGHFSKQSYARSYKDYKNAAIAVSQWDYRYGTNTSAQGLGKRFAWIDASDITHDTAPATGGSHHASDNPPRVDHLVLPPKITQALNEHKLLTNFSGEVATDIPFKLGVDYNLGDVIQVIGKYGVNQKMRVSEYIRMSDDQGDRAYPTLEEPFVTEPTTS